MKSALGSLVLGMSLALPAQATIYTFAYTGVIERIVEHDYPFPSEEVGGTVLGGWTGPYVALRETVSGTFSYDDTAPNETQNEHQGYYRGDSVDLFFQFDRSGFKLGGSDVQDTVFIADAQAPVVLDGVQYGDYAMVSGYDDAQNVLLRLEFSESTANLLDDVALFGDRWNEFESATFLYSWGFHNYGHETEISGSLTSVKLVSAVPEPATCAMLFAGLGVLAWSRARRRPGCSRR